MRKHKWFMMFEGLILLGVLYSTRGCTQPDHARKVLENNGYTQIQMTGFRWFGCGAGDVYQDGFKAKSPVGIEVTGVVCGGLAKKLTIRFD